MADRTAPESDLAALRRLLGPELLDALEHWEDTAGLGADEVARLLSARWQQALADAPRSDAS